MIPDEAVEAARDALWNAPAGSAAVTDLPDDTVRIILEAAAPHLMASRQSITDVLAAHQLHSGERGMNRRCKCGWLGQVFGNDFEKDFITHQADMLTVAQRKGLTK